MKNFKIVVEYDGTDYHGWQIQPDKKTIQGEITKAVAKITNVSLDEVNVIGSGRTDAGVHALGQVANFKTESSIEPGSFLKGLNSLLPNDIVIKSLKEVPESFNARKSATKKVYRYIILNRKIPTALDRNRVYFVNRPLDLFKMKKSLTLFIGEKDFVSFQGSGSDVKSTKRTVSEFTMNVLDDGYLVFEIVANGFLKHMVRNIMGTVIEIGLGKLQLYKIDQIFESKNRSEAGFTAPPQGLYLKEVIYENY